MARDVIMHLSLDEIVVRDERRAVDMEAVKRLAVSIKGIGLQHPITVRSKGGEFILVAGRHRLEAARHIGDERIAAVVSKMDDVDAEMWEISENLHRADLTKLQRDEQISRWIELQDAKRVLAQSGPKPSHRPESGVRAAARELGVERHDAQRAEQVASLSPEAKQVATEIGLDDNRAALLQAKKAGNGSSEAEVKYLRDRVAAQEAERARKEADKANRDTDRVVTLSRIDQAAELICKRLDLEQIDSFISWVDGSSIKDLTAALRRRLAGDQPIMDRRYA